jgi:LysR family transcriptional activator for leuABCD operon
MFIKINMPPNVNILISPDYQDISARQDDLRLRKVDFIFATRPIQDRGYHNHLLTEQPLVVVCKSQHPRIKDELSESQFFSERHLSWIKQSNGIMNSNESAASKHDKRDIAYHADSVFSALIMAVQTDGLCVAGLWHAQRLADFGQIKTFKVPFNTNPIPVYMSWHQQSDPRQEWLKNAIVEAFKGK